MDFVGGLDAAFDSDYGEETKKEQPVAKKVEEPVEEATVDMDFVGGLDAAFDSDY